MQTIEQGILRQSDYPAKALLTGHLGTAKDCLGWGITRRGVGWTLQIRTSNILAAESKLLATDVVVIIHAGCHVAVKWRRYRRMNACKMMRRSCEGVRRTTTLLDGMVAWPWWSGGAHAFR